MGEFGHNFITAPDLCIDSWGDGPFLLTVEGKTFCFIDSDRFGPHLATRQGDPLKNPWPAQRSPFWRAHRIWKRQGRRLEDGKVCLWDEPKPQVVRMIGKRSAFIVEPGEKDGKVIVESTDQKPSQDR